MGVFKVKNWILRFHNVLLSRLNFLRGILGDFCRGTQSGLGDLSRLQCDKLLEFYVDMMKKIQ